MEQSISRSFPVKKYTSHALDMAPQPGSLLVPAIEKPPLTRSRSSTAPHGQPHPTLNPFAARPGSSARSHSYLSPVSPQPRTSQTLPIPVAPSSSRLHIPGASGLHRPDHEHRNRSRHKHTQSDVLGGKSRSHRRDKSDDLPHLTAGIAAEIGGKGEKTKLASDLWGARADELRRIATNRSDRGRTGESSSAKGAELRRGNSDPKRRPQQAPQSRVEMLLDRAETKKMADRAAVTQKDVDKLRQNTAAAETELQRRLATVNKTSVDITRRLDYTYYNILEKVGNLVAIVQSFHSLSSQTKDMIEVFAKDASMLERDVKIKVERLKTSFDEKDSHAKGLEDRGARANAKAQDLGARLENARQRVEAWEKKEGAERRRRSWFWKGIWIAFSVVMLVIFFGLTWREWRSEADIVRMALMDQKGDFGPSNRSLLPNDDAVARMRVPDDVKDVLSGIRERQRSRPAGQPVHTESVVTPVDHQVDERLKALDEL